MRELKPLLRALTLLLTLALLAGCGNKTENRPDEQPTEPPARNESSDSEAEAREISKKERGATTVADDLEKEADEDEGMVEIPAGTFKMSKVEHTQFGPAPGEFVEVELPAYLIDVHEVTVAEYRACVEAGACEKPLETHEDWKTNNWGAEGRDDHPVNGISWAQASAYCKWAGKRLPTEAEWEKAARGDDGRVYPWGESAPTCELAVFKQREAGCGTETTEPVGSKSKGASPYGAHDMVGNVSEWVADYTDLAPEPAPVDRGKKVHRGGNFKSSADNVQVTQRFYVSPESGGSTIGFRCVKSSE